VLEALAKGGAMTASEIAEATGLGRATISSTLTRLARSGDVAKAARGYQLPGTTVTSKANRAKPRASKQRASKPRASKPRASKPRASKAQASAKSASAPAQASTATRSAPGATKASILAALSTEQGATSGDVAAATGISRGTVSTTLSRLVKTGDVIKAERGYVLPG
jgi:DNA-binding IclR family transcriptional regulator